MGRGVEVLVFPLAAMALLSVAAVFAAFFNRTAAKACAGTSVGLAVLFMIVVLNLNDWNPRAVIDAVRSVPDLFAVIGGSLVLSAVAVRAPLRRPGTTRPDGGMTPGRPRWGLLVLAVGITAAGVGYGVALLADACRGEEKTRALLAGDPNPRLERVQIVHGQRRVICSDPEVLRYLEERLRRHEPDPDFLGTSYELSLTYVGGGTQAFACYWADSGDANLFLGEPGEGGRGHGIRFPRPRPKAVEELVSFLLEPVREAAGEVLILEAGGVRTERDESLVAR